HVYRVLVARISYPYSDYTVRTIVAWDGASGVAMKSWVPSYDTLISSTAEEKALYFGGAVPLHAGRAIAVMDKQPTYGRIDLYMFPDDYLPPTTIAPTLTERQTKILATTRTYTSSYRRVMFGRYRVAQQEFDELREMGLLDRRGAITITGRNVVGDAAPWYEYEL
ncbi:hypothetical protein LCGC14_2862690, partial [marine sediment metagenome]